MISAKQAKQIILSNTQNWGVEKISIENSTNRILQENINADRNFPPFDRVTMDGIAINTDDFNKGLRIFEISAIQTAGQEAKTLQQKGHAIEIMTGAILSKNADANIRYEDLNIQQKDGKRIAKVKVQQVLKWQNIHKKGTDKLKGDLLISKGRKLQSADIAILATVGKSEVIVSKLPKVAIISTGDELVAVNKRPNSNQIRISNSVAIQSKLNELAIKNDSFHLPDDYQTILQKSKIIIGQYDVIILSGGVSKGKADYIPDVLNQLEVNKLFHRVAQKPGKPFWFGKNSENKCVFALPGNPVSTLMCFTTYFLPWLFNALKLQYYNLPKAILSENYIFKPQLTYYLQVNTSINEEGKIIAKPTTGGGSGDLSNLLEANAFLELPANRMNYKAGDVFPLFPFRNFYCF